MKSLFVKGAGFRQNLGARTLVRFTARLGRASNSRGRRAVECGSQAQFMKRAKGARTPRPREPIQPEHADEASALLHELALGRSGLKAALLWLVLTCFTSTAEAADASPTNAFRFI